MADIIQLRRDDAASWTAANPVLANGELGLETDTYKLKWGDGVTAWVDLAYYASGIEEVPQIPPPNEGEEPADPIRYVREQDGHWVPETVTTDHNTLGGKGTPDQHPIDAITGLQGALDLKTRIFFATTEPDQSVSNTGDLWYKL